ncbi:MAG: hypothetical protein JSU77_09295 [Fidelibacterota bacterium]|nr:MAG: hypothetical protein JSU77_09295 [Candidatus Neomarinimicrobiota bacterium]
MIQDTGVKEQLIDATLLSEGERDELIRLGILSEEGLIQSAPIHPTERSIIQKQAVQAPEVLNDAFDYSPIPSSFSRGLAFELNGYKILLISGTASVDENGKSIHVGDFRAQCWRTYRNITALLESEGMTWQDVVRTTCYLRDIERDYKDFNEIRTAFLNWQHLDPLPASTGIQARLCRENLLVEIDAVAICPSSSTKGR